MNILLGMTGYESFNWRRSHQTKAEFLFQNLPVDVANSLKMDDIATFSTTDAKTADNIVKFLLKWLPANATIIDATACIGGSAFALANTFKEVKAIEIDPIRYKHLLDNIKMLNLSNLKCFCGDALEIIPRLEHHDLIFIDPPWGGPEYKTETNVSLFLSNMALNKVCDKLAPYTQYIAIKVPTNFNCDLFINSLEKMKFYCINTHLRKMHLIILETLRCSW